MDEHLQVYTANSFQQEWLVSIFSSKSLSGRLFWLYLHVVMVWLYLHIVMVWLYLHVAIQTKKIDKRKMQAAEGTQ